MKLSCFSYGKYHKIFIYLIIHDNFIIYLKVKNREIIIDLCNFKNKKKEDVKKILRLLFIYPFAIFSCYFADYFRGLELMNSPYIK